MKNRNFIKNSIVALLPISLGLGVLLGVNKKPAEKIDAYSGSSLPTTIDLNDTTPSNIRSYYSSLNSLDTSERQGTNLLKNLKTILKKGQQYFSYDSGDTIWEMYEITDRDWVNSPATSISGYNDSTKKISNYSYNSSDPYVHALYVNRSVTNQTKAWADHQQTQWGINREHVWPKAEGFDTKGAGGARGDPMHLMAGNGYANNIHSNNYYGYVNTSSSYTNCGTKYSNLSGNLSGKSKTLGGSTTVFEPQDSDKGDIARAIFYMVARYNYLSESDNDGINANNPNLTLTQSLSDWASSGYTSTTDNPGKMGVMTDLLAWHKADPVDSYEIHRNNLLYTNFTKNRNPFIDFPEWADYIWGTVSYTGSTYNKYTSTPTGYATPSSDTINGYNSGGGETVAVTGVSLNTASTSVEAGEDVTLTPTIAPSTATNQMVTWSTSDASVATVSGGIVTGVSEGSATITVRTSDGGFTATCSVTVTASSGGGGTIVTWNKVTNPSNLSEGDTIIIANSASTYALSTNQATNNRSGVSVTESNNQITWEEGDRVPQELTLTSTGSVSSPPANSYGLSTGGGYLYAAGSNANQLKTENTLSINGAFVFSYTDGAMNINATGSSNRYVMRYNPNNGSPIFACYALNTTTGTALSVYKKTVTEQSDKELESISVDASDAQTTFYIGDTFNYEDLVVTANYDDGSSEILSSGYVVSTPDMTTYGEKTVTVTYEENSIEKSASYTIHLLYPGSSDNFQMIVSKPTSSYYADGAIYLTGTAQLGTAECDAFTAVQTKSGSSDILYTQDEIRVYGNHSFSITPKAGYELTSIIIFAHTNEYANKIGGGAEPSNYSKTTNGKVVTLTPTDGSLEVRFRNAYVSWIEYIIVNFEESVLYWDSPTINVFSGSTLTGSEVNDWGVNDGTTTYTYSQLTIKLDGEAIAIPYVWKADDDGKTLTASRNGISTSESEAVVVTQTVNNIYKTAEPTSGTVTWTASAANNLGSPIASVNGTDTGTISTGSFEWDYTRTLLALGDNKSDNITYPGDTWIQMGSNNAMEKLELTTSAIPGTITRVSVVAASASGNHKITIQVGESKYLESEDLLSYTGSATATNPSPSAVGAAVIGEGTSSGTITISFIPSSSTKKALLIRSISVSYQVSGGQQQIANSVDHIPAQRAAVKFAKAFNAAMANTAYCTTGLDAAWTTCSSAYNTFKSEAAALGSTEEAYAKNLIKYATVQYSNDSGEACIERMMKTYEICVNQHGKSEFMSDLITVGSNQVSPILINLSQNKSIGFIIIISAIGVGVIGGYFFMKSRRKEDF